MRPGVLGQALQLTRFFDCHCSSRCGRRPSHGVPTSVKFLPAEKRGGEVAPMSVSALIAFRTAVSRTVWSKTLPVTNTLAL